MSSDPLNIISNPPSTFVKVQGTSRADLNGQLGLAFQYNADRGRYMVQMTGSNSGSSPTVMALKAENLTKASTFETYKAQFQMLRNDPRVKQELTRYYSLVQSKLPANVKPEHAAGGVAVVLFGLIFLIGFTRMLMLLSLVIMLGMIIGPDLVSGGPVNFQVIAANFPGRCREILEQSAPTLLRGRLTNNIAAGIVVAMLLFSAKAVITPTSRAVSAPPKAASIGTEDFGAGKAGTNPGKMSIDDAYKLGFEDATQERTFGASMTSYAEARRTASDENSEDFYDDYISAPTPEPKQSFGLGQMMSLMYLYRTVTELGGNPLNGTFSVERLVAGARSMEPWKYGMIGFSFYNLVKIAL